MSRKTSVAALAPLLKTPYSNVELGAVNDHAAYLMNFKGRYPMHSHAQDELYFVLEGEIIVRFENGTAERLQKGECLGVPAHVTHSSESEAGALVMMVKPRDMFPTPEELE